MIDVKTAVRSAIGQVTELFGADQLTDLRLEEVERSEDDRYWLVTVGFYPRRQSDEMLSPMLRRASLADRVYKRLKIDAASGEVASMTIRTP
jgi:hypothetical protein